MRPQLTKKQAAVLDVLRRNADEGAPPPTNREICDAFGWASTRAARDHLNALGRKGYIEVSKGRGHRKVRLLDQESPIARVPLLGEVVAGSPIPSEEQAEGRIPVPANWTNNDVCFALRVKGDSMKDAGILDGDRVVVRQVASASDGDIVVATLDGETTLKRLRRRGKRLTLVAENAAYHPIEVQTESARIQGVVVGLIREYCERSKSMRLDARFKPTGDAHV